MELTKRMLLLAALLLAVAAPARAVTVDDIVALSQSGVGADVLIAVIDADRTVFSLSRDEILALRKAGVPDAVIVRMLESRRDFAEAPQEPLIVGTRPPSVSDSFAPVAVVPAFIPYPVFIGIPVFPVPIAIEPARGFGRFVNDGWIEGRGFGRFITGTPPVR